MGDSYFSFTSLDNVYQTVTDVTCVLLVVLLLLENGSQLLRRIKWWRADRSSERGSGSVWRHNSVPLLQGSSSSSSLRDY